MPAAVSHRLQITLSDGQYHALLKEQSQRGVSLAELVRQAVEHRYGRARTMEERLAALQSGYGAWANRDEAGDPHAEWRALRPPMGPPPD